MGIAMADAFETLFVEQPLCFHRGNCQYLVVFGIDSVIDRFAWASASSDEDGSARSAFSVQVLSDFFGPTSRMTARLCAVMGVSHIHQPDYSLTQICD